MKNITDIHITSKTKLPTPVELCNTIKRDINIENFVIETRASINEIIFGNDPRLLIIVGPCSVHDIESGMEYAKRLSELSQKLSKRLLIVMRVYFEKPRTTVGWKGLIMDPKLDGTSDIESGLLIARSFLKDVLKLNLATATELLDPITPQYIADLICWGAIGARTTESQTHRQMASGLSMPLGFKNGTDGNIDVAINAIQAASNPQTFLGIDNQGLANALTTKGNHNCHIVLRGGSKGPNYHEKEIALVEASLKLAKQKAAIMIDCSHANSNKDYREQPKVFSNVVKQSIANRNIIGAMVESNLSEGNQKLTSDTKSLQYGVSITDSCISWEMTEKILKDAYEELSPLFE